MSESPPTPPVARVAPHEVVSPNGNRTDPYYWLRDDERANPEVLAYLAAENAYRREVMAPLKPLEDRVYLEIVGRLKQDDSTVPYFKRGYWYSTRYETGQEHPIFVRRLGSLEAAEEVLLDANALAKGHDFYQIGAMAISEDNRLLAYCEDTVGRRQFTLRFKNLESGEPVDVAIGNVEADIVWASDNRTLLYVEKEPETLLGVYVKKHVLGEPVEADQLLFEQKDLSFYTGVGKSKSGAYLFIHMQSTVSSEWRYARADDPNLQFHVFLPAERDHEYDLEHAGEYFLVRSNFKAKNFKLAAAKIGAGADREAWIEIIAHRDTVLIEEFELFEDCIALSVRSGGLSKIALKPWNAKAPHAVSEERFLDSDEPAYSMGLGANAELGSEWLRYGYSSLTTPATVYDYNLKSGERRLMKREPVLGDFDPKRYRTEFLFITARDGTQVPASIVYAHQTERERAPLLVYGYGAYGISMEPSFSAVRLSLLDRGFVYAIAHVRGGEEMGRGWYESGRQLNKRNSFFDFIDVTRALVSKGYGAADKVFAMGGSAGGLLMGAVANLGGENYRAMVAQVPFVDVVTTMLDDTIPLTSNEYDEWGNPNESRFYDYMLSYAPYDNVAAKSYPALLITTGLWDSQVQYYEPVKWAAKLRAMKTDSNPLLLHIEMEAGHGGKSGRFQRYRDIAMEYAFLIDQAGLRE